MTDRRDQPAGRMINSTFMSTSGNRAEAVIEHTGERSETLLSQPDRNTLFALLLEWRISVLLNWSELDQPETSPLISLPTAAGAPDISTRTCRPIQNSHLLARR